MCIFDACVCKWGSAYPGRHADSEACAKDGSGGDPLVKIEGVVSITGRTLSEGTNPACIFDDAANPVGTGTALPDAAEAANLAGATAAPVVPGYPWSEVLKPGASPTAGRHPPSVAGDINAFEKLNTLDVIK